MRYHAFSAHDGKIIIAAALKQFALKEVDVLVLEVGLGGRLDATTAHTYRPMTVSFKRN